MQKMVCRRPGKPNIYPFDIGEWIVKMPDGTLVPYGGSTPDMIAEIARMQPYYGAHSE